MKNQLNAHTLEGNLLIQIGQCLQPLFIKLSTRPVVYASNENVAMPVNFLFFGGAHGVECFTIHPEYAGSCFRTDRRNCGSRLAMRWLAIVVESSPYDTDNMFHQRYVKFGLMAGRFR